MPTPNPRESRDDFVSRCIPIVINEGTTDDSSQAAAICNSMWEDAQKDKDMSKNMEHKTFPGMVVKADEEQGIVDAFFAVFGNVDEGQDVIFPGAFAKTFSERGHKVRVLDNHRTDSIMRAIGKPVMLKEVKREELPGDLLLRHPDADGGAFASIQMLMDTPEGKGAFIRLRDKAVTEWSFGYDPVRFDFDTRQADGREVNVRNLREVKLYEVSPVLFAMNEATTTVGAKSGKMEQKPEPEVTENTIRIRVRNPGDFQQDSFRTIDIDKEQGIQAVIGRLKGETTTTVQAYIFDKEKWTVSRAQAWVEEHEKAVNLAIELKIGRAISAANMAKIQNAIDGIQQQLEQLERMLTGEQPPDDEESDDKAGPDSAPPPNARPDDAPPTERDKTLRELYIMAAEMQLSEVT